MHVMHKSDYIAQCFKYIHIFKTAWFFIQNPNNPRLTIARFCKFKRKQKIKQCMLIFNTKRKYILLLIFQYNVLSILLHLVTKIMFVI